MAVSKQFPQYSQIPWTYQLRAGEDAEPLVLHWWRDWRGAMLGKLRFPLAIEGPAWQKPWGEGQKVWVLQQKTKLIHQTLQRLHESQTICKSNAELRFSIAKLLDTFWVKTLWSDLKSFSTLFASEAIWYLTQSYRTAQIYNFKMASHTIATSHRPGFPHRSSPHSPWGKSTAQGPCCLT